MLTNILGRSPVPLLPPAWAKTVVVRSLERKVKDASHKCKKEEKVTLDKGPGKTVAGGHHT
jgi:hypothetical protein